MLLARPKKSKLTHVTETLNEGKENRRDRVRKVTKAIISRSLWNTVENFRERKPLENSEERHAVI